MQPTQGLDVGAIETVHRLLLEQRTQGVAILLISEELDELLAAERPDRRDLRRPDRRRSERRRCRADRAADDGVGGHERQTTSRDPNTGACHFLGSGVEPREQIPRWLPRGDLVRRDRVWR